MKDKELPVWVNLKKSNGVHFDYKVWASIPEAIKMVQHHHSFNETTFLDGFAGAIFAKTANYEIYARHCPSGWRCSSMKTLRRKNGQA